MEQGNSLSISTANVFGAKMYNTHHGDLPPPVQKYFGIKHCAPFIIANDSGRTFEEIADYIEENTDHLFWGENVSKS